MYDSQTSSAEVYFEFPVVIISGKRKTGLKNAKKGWKPQNLLLFAQVPYHQ